MPMGEPQGNWVKPTQALLGQPTLTAALYNCKAQKNIAAVNTYNW